MAKLLTDVGIIISIISLITTIILFLIPLINKVYKTRKEIKRNLNEGIVYQLNNKIEEARSEYKNALKYQDNRFCKRLIIKIKINLYETFHHDKVDREKGLEYAKIKEEALLNEIYNYKVKRNNYIKTDDEIALTREVKVNYEVKKNIIWSKYKYEYAILYSNLGNVYNELALIRDAKNNYENSKMYSLLAIDVFSKINKFNSNYISVLGTTFCNLAITYRGLANLNKDSNLLRLSLKNAEKSVMLFEEIKDYYNIAKVHNNIGNIYSDLVLYNENEKENYYINSEKYFYKSLEFYRIEKYPYEFARSHQNIGSVNLCMMYYCENREKAYTFFIKSEENYVMCKDVFKKNKYENEYIILHYNLMSLHFQALKKLGEIHLLTKVEFNGNIILEACTIQSNPKIYINTNVILANAYIFSIEICEFNTERDKIDLIEKAISIYEIVLKFNELSMNNKSKTLVDLTRLYMTLFDMTDLKIYEEKCNYYCKELEKIIKSNPDSMNEIEDMFIIN